jgi:hypothetical protein
MARILRLLLLLASALPVAAFAQEDIPPSDSQELPAAEPPTQPPPAPATPSLEAPAPAGQWVYTEQYGWIWMPYDAAYTRAPSDGEPYMFVYGPELGWTWVAAPWVWGWGPIPYFGVYGGVRFSWWGHGWGPGWRVHRPFAFRHRYPYPLHYRPFFRHAPGFGHPSFRSPHRPPERFERGGRDQGRPARPARRPERGGRDHGWDHR